MSALTPEPGAVLGMGNPLLDISAVVPQEFLDKYGLQMANQILAEEKHAPMFAEMVANFPVEYIAGGATQNSIRVCQWMLQAPHSCSGYMGCIGNDEFGEKMKAQAAADNVTVSYMVDEATPTGTCAVCVKDSERSLVANLAAANNYKIAHLEKPENWAMVEAAKVVYSAGFFITVSPDSMMKVAQHCCEENKVYCLNLSAPFIVEVPPFLEALKNLLPYVDYLFGNETEAMAFSKAMGWDCKDVSEVAAKAARLPKQNGGRQRTVVFTQGGEDTLVARDGVVTNYPVPAVKKEEIVDTNGAGDAFVGGFLSQLCRPVAKHISDMVRAGNYAASCIIKVSGCKMEGEPISL
ncbi:hypothetical protein PPROV_000191700 [Pycnococcus provasolii]|uniref:Adenosine kinase n=2 Tax=Pycnococcus provasolii TaxID=41880 RepID=A0A830H979_9CHLO|nr:hypothetical protein PPROV_000191700 [Pycnococcus provasolii]